MKVAFFDIDGTLTSEIDGSVPRSAIEAIRCARANGNLMLLNTGRCFQNVEDRFRQVGFDGYVCGCGTHIVLNDEDLLYVQQPAEIIKQIIAAARATEVDLLLESRQMVSFDHTRKLRHPDAIRQDSHFAGKGYPMDIDIDAEGFTCDKFVIWYEREEQLEKFRSVSDKWFDCIDRGGTFREFVPLGYSKATGIQFVLDKVGASLNDAYAFGDSNNDLAMLSYVPNSVAMGNSEPESLKSLVSYVTDNSSRDGIQKALKALGFI